MLSGIGVVWSDGGEWNDLLEMDVVVFVVVRGKMVRRLSAVGRVLSLSAIQVTFLRIGFLEQGQ